MLSSRLRTMYLMMMDDDDDDVEAGLCAELAAEDNVPDDGGAEPPPLHLQHPRHQPGLRGLAAAGKEVKIYLHSTVLETKET